MKDSSIINPGIRLAVGVSRAADAMLNQETTVVSACRESAERVRAYKANLALRQAEKSDA
jgi:hypothetical protein